MRMNWMLWVAVGVMAVGPGLAQTVPTTPTLSGGKLPAVNSRAALEEGSSKEAIAWLRKLEEKNADLKSMTGKFAQTKTSAMFREQHTYTGRFYYLKPNQFRIDYTGKDGEKDESTILILANEMWDYVPSIEQATKYDLRSESGEQREINQFLLAFGVQTEKALEYFRVTTGEKDPSGSTFTLVFEAKDPDETMQFLKATITFDTKSLRPKMIVLEEAMGDRTEIAMGDVELNAGVKESRFSPDWPKGTEILEQ